MTSDDLKVFFITNGEAYSDFAVYGGVIGKESDRATIEAILRYALQEIKIQEAARTEKIAARVIATWVKEQRELPPGTPQYWAIEKAIPSIDQDEVFTDKFKEHGFTFTPFNADFEAL